MRRFIWLRRIVWFCLAFIAAISLFVGGVWWWLHPTVVRTEGVVYAVRKGKDLTVDVLRPRGAKGRGVITLVSGGWKSRRDSLQDIIVAPLLRRGYTIFILV